MNNVSISKELIKTVENTFLENLNKERNTQVKVGDVIKLQYKVPDGDKERIQSYEGLVIAKQNKGLGKSFTLRRNVDGIGVEQVFLEHSPKIVAIKINQASKIRRSKLYFIRQLRGKSARLKIKR